MSNSDSAVDTGETDDDAATAVARYRRADGDRESERRIEVTDDNGLAVRFYAADGDETVYDRTFAWPAFVALLAAAEASTAAVTGSVTERAFVDGEIDTSVVAREPGPKEPGVHSVGSDGDRRERLRIEAVGGDASDADGATDASDADGATDASDADGATDASDADGATDAARLSIQPVTDGDAGDWTVTGAELATLLTPGAADDRADLVAEAGFSEAFRRALFVYRDDVIVRELL